MEKAPDAFRTISEVAEDLDLPQHVLRFWETRFTQIKPLKRGGGRRYYRPDDIDLLKGIRYYLYGEGYTIKGVQRILKERGVKHAIEMGRAVTENYAPPVAVIPKADEERRQRARADDWPEAEPLRPRLDAAFDARDLDQPADLAGLEYSDGDVDELEPPPVEISAPSPIAPQQPLPAALSPTPNLTRDDMRRLQSTLFELMECKRILDSVR